MFAPTLEKANSALAGNWRRCSVRAVLVLALDHVFPTERVVVEELFDSVFGALPASHVFVNATPHCLQT